MDPQIWGKSVWSALVYIVVNYPNKPTSEDKTNIKAFLEAIGPVLPCPSCRDSYVKDFVKYPPDLRSRDDLLQWLTDLHNRSTKGNKYTVKDMIKKYAKKI
jgi:FAD-linked sulfhydryl oxidase